MDANVTTTVIATSNIETTESEPLNDELGIIRIVFDVFIICLALYFLLYWCKVNQKGSENSEEDNAARDQENELIIDYTHREETIFPVLGIIAIGFIVFEVLSIIFGDEYYRYDIDVSATDDSLIIPLSRLMTFLQFLEKQMILGWMLHEQDTDAALNVKLRIIATSGSLLIGFVFVVFAIFEADILLRGLLFFINGVDFVVTLVSMIYSRFKISCKDVCDCIWNKIRDRSGGVNTAHLGMDAGLMTQKSKSVRKSAGSLPGIGMDNIDGSNSDWGSFLIIFALCLICIESLLFDIGFLIHLVNEDDFILQEYQWYVTLNRGIMFIYCVVILVVISRTENKEVSRLQKKNSDKIIKEMTACNSPIQQESELEIIAPESKDNIFSQHEEKMISNYFSYRRGDKRKNRHKFENITTTFIGVGGVGKTLLVRALWKGDIATCEEEKKVNDTNVNMNHDFNGVVDHTGQKICIDFSKIDVRPANLETVLKDYNHDNLIDFYCRWDKVLRRSFRFFDTVGDETSILNSLICMEKSDIIIAMYNLRLDSNSSDESIGFLQKFDKKINEILDDKNKFDKFTIVIGVSSIPLTTELRNIHKEQVKVLSNLPHFTVLGNHAIYMDPEKPCETLRIADLVELLLKIETTHKLKATNSEHTNNIVSICQRIGVETHNKNIQKYDGNRLVVRAVRQQHVENVQNERKIVRGPACVHNTEFRRPKGKILKRFLTCFFGGLICFPLIITMQTCVFWLYSAEWGFTNDGLVKLIEKFPFEDLGQLPLDFLYGLQLFYRGLADPLMDAGLRSLFERQILAKKRSSMRDANDNGKNSNSTQYNSAVDWFLRQTFSQKIWRTVIVFYALLLEICIGYNVYYFFRHGGEEDNRISNLESIGGLGLFVWFWVMVSAWYAGNTVVSNSNVNLLTNSKQRQSMRMLFKPIYSGGIITSNNTQKSLYATNVDVFLRGYAFSRNSLNFENVFGGGKSSRCCNCEISIKTMVFVFMSLVFAFLPGITREIQGRYFKHINGVDVSDYKFIPSSPEWHDFEYDFERNTVIRAIIINFTCLFLVISFLDNIRIASFIEYLKIMKYITKLIEIPRALTVDKGDTMTENVNITSSNLSDKFNNNNKIESSDDKYDIDIFTDGSETERLIKTRTQINWSNPADEVDEKKNDSDSNNNDEVSPNTKVDSAGNVDGKNNHHNMDDKGDADETNEYAKDSKSTMLKLFAAQGDGTSSTSKKSKVVPEDTDYNDHDNELDMVNDNETESVVTEMQVHICNEVIEIDVLNHDYGSNVNDNEYTTPNKTVSQTKEDINHFDQNPLQSTSLVAGNSNLQGTGSQNTQHGHNDNDNANDSHNDNDDNSKTNVHSGNKSNVLKDSKSNDHDFELKFLCLDDPENLVAYMEIRDYAYSTGKQLFGELEPLVTISGLIIIGQASWVVGALWVGKELEGQSVYGAYYMFIITLGWAIWCMFLGRKFDKLQTRQVKALTNQRTCMQSEVITQAVFTCPDIWNDLKVGKWNQLYELTHRYSKIFDDNFNDNDSGENANDQKRFRKLQYLKNSFYDYIELIKTCQNKLEENNIHPKIFGISLSGALFNTVIGTFIAAVVALIKLIFF